MARFLESIGKRAPSPIPKIINKITLFSSSIAKEDDGEEDDVRHLLCLEEFFLLILLPFCYQESKIIRRRGGKIALRSICGYFKVSHILFIAQRSTHNYLNSKERLIQDVAPLWTSITVPLRSVYQLLFID